MLKKWKMSENIWLDWLQQTNVIEQNNEGGLMQTKYSKGDTWVRILQKQE